MLNAEQIIWEYLTATGTTLYSAVAKRIWADEAPQAGSGWANDSAAIIFEVTQTLPHETAGILECFVDFYCYGGDAGNAHPSHNSVGTVYRALYDRLHNGSAQTASGAVMVAHQTGARTGLREADTEWPYSIATYRIVVQAAAA